MFERFFQFIRENLKNAIVGAVDDAQVEINQRIEMRAVPQAPVIETNGHPQPERLTATELRGMRKPELIAVAEDAGLAVDESWTVPELRDALKEV